MQALSREQYQWLESLAQAYLRQHGREYRTAEKRNPRLGVDALCFQHHGEAMLGVLITPLSLSLLWVPLHDNVSRPSVRSRIVTLPSGRYPFVREVLHNGAILWRCELLDDLSTLDGPSDASRLAQHLMQCVMAPADNDAETGA